MREADKGGAGKGNQGRGQERGPRKEDERESMAEMSVLYGNEKQGKGAMSWRSLGRGQGENSQEEP